MQHARISLNFFQVLERLINSCLMISKKKKSSINKRRHNFSFFQYRNVQFTSSEIELLNRYDDQEKLKIININSKIL